MVGTLRFAHPTVLLTVMRILSRVSKAQHAHHEV